MGEQRQPVTVGEVAEKVGADRATAYRMLMTLVQAGYVRRDADGQALPAELQGALARAGTWSTRTSGPARSSRPCAASPRRPPRPCTTRCSTATRRCCSSAPRAAQRVAVDFQIGDRSPLHCTSIGKVLLAYQRRSRRRGRHRGRPAQGRAEHHHRPRGAAARAGAGPGAGLRLRRSRVRARHALRGGAGVRERRRGARRASPSPARAAASTRRSSMPCARSPSAMPKTCRCGWAATSRGQPAIDRCRGAPRETRTPDLLITNQSLYRLSYRGTAASIAGRGRADQS